MERFLFLICSLVLFPAALTPTRSHLSTQHKRNAMRNLPDVPRRGCADRRFQSGRGEISSAQERSAARLHHHRDSAVGYSNADRWATPVLQADRRVDFAKKHRGASLERSFAALRQRLRGETMKRNLMILPMKTEESNLGFNILLPFFSPLRLIDF